MGNPSRTPQNSIFEPLFSHEEHLLTLPTTHLTHSSSSEWLTSSTYSSAISPATCNNQLRKSPATTFMSQDIMMSTHPTNIDRNSGAAAEPATSRRHANCGSIHHHHHHHHDHGNLSSSSTDHGLPDASMLTSVPPSRSFSLSHVEHDDNDDDGSVATKLLASITKSISSPSLLSCCKESARETPYQKSLKLRMMKLQHCAEELGSESSDHCKSTYISDGGNDSSFDSLATMAPSPQSAGTTMDQRIERTEATSPMMISVRSAPNLRCSSLASIRHSSHVRSERSFPPPLTHTLPRSASSDSFAFSLRAYREDGRFMLKEVKVPCRQYLQANRKDGRLTLQLIFTADDDDDADEQEELSAHKESEDTTDLAPREGITVVDKEAGDQLHGDKLGVESAGRVADVGGGLGVIAEKESVHVIMDEIADRGAGKADDDTLSQSGPLCTSRPSDLNGAKRRRLRNQPSIVCLRILSSPCKLNSLPPGNIPRLKFVGPVTTFSQCDQENLVLQRRPSKNAAQDKLGVKAMLGRLEMVPDGLQGGGIGIDNRGVSRMIVFKDVGAKSLMEIVTKLVSSLGLEGGKWCHTKAIARGVQGSGFKDRQLKVSSMYDGTRSIDIAGVRKHKRNGARVEGEREPARRCIDAFDEEGGGFARINTEGVSTTMSTTVHIDVQVPWVHSLHCKELFGRNQFGSKGLSWVAIRT